MKQLGEISTLLFQANDLLKKREEKRSDGLGKEKMDGQKKLFEEQVKMIEAEKDGLNETVMDLESRLTHAILELQFEREKSKEVKVAWLELRAQNDLYKQSNANLQSEVQMLKSQVQAERKAYEEELARTKLKYEQEIYIIKRESENYKASTNY
jgi:hypothetical protein